MGRNQYTKYKHIPHICYGCDSTVTSRNTRGCPNWYLNLPTNLMLCDRCYGKLFEKVRAREYSYPRLMRFKGKQILLSKPPRRGICQNCGKRGYTHMHHEQYNDNDPLAHTIELCVACHNHESWKNGSFDHRWEKRRMKLGP